MSNGKGSGDTEKNAPPRDSGDDSDDESEILEESPCGRWQKRREEVQQQEVPGIDHAFLAMDTEEGVEVVWNEVQFSEKKNFKAKQDDIKVVFDNLINLEHANIAKLHKYWFDTKHETPRVVFITEYMSSGSLKQFLIRAKSNTSKRSLKAWKRWTTQILSALSYLHAYEPPIIHGNLTLDMIFLQHNGLIKISSVAPDAIHNHVRTCKEQLKNMHYVAPEYGTAAMSPAVDIYSFGVCALEMLARDLPPTGDGNVAITPEYVHKAIESIDDPAQKDFVSLCLAQDPLTRPSARDLLFHPALFEVHALKLVAAHALVRQLSLLSKENLKEEVYQKLRVDDPQRVVAELVRHGPAHGDNESTTVWRYSQVPEARELEKFIEDVKNGVYPIISNQNVQMNIPPKPGSISPEVAESVQSETPEQHDRETRLVLTSTCTISRPASAAAASDHQTPATLQMQLLLRLDDRMNRQLTCELTEDESPVALADELVRYGFINEMDRDKIATVIEEHVAQFTSRSMSPPQQPQSQHPANAASSTAAQTSNVTAAAQTAGGAAASAAHASVAAPPVNSAAAAAPPAPAAAGAPTVATAAAEAAAVTSVATAAVSGPGPSAST